MIAEWTIIFVTILVVMIASIGINFVNRNNNRPEFVILSPAIFAIAPILFGLNTYGGIYFGAFLENGWNIVGVVIGTTFFLTLGLPCLKSIAKIVRVQNIKSLPDLLSARYGKKHYLTVITTLIILSVSIPILGIQIWYLNYNTSVVVDFLSVNYAQEPLEKYDANGSFLLIFLLFFTAYLAIRSTKYTNGTDGIIFAISITAIVSLLLFFIASLDVVYFEHDGVFDLINLFNKNTENQQLVNDVVSFPVIIILIFLIGFGLIFTPWQFHLLFVENTNSNGLNKSRNILAPMFILIFIMFTILAMGSVNQVVGLQGDIVNFSTIDLLLSHNSITLAILLFLTTNISLILLMVIEILVIATIISNDIVLPVLIRSFGRDSLMRNQSDKLIKLAKRLVICLTLTLAYLSYMYLPYKGYNESLLFGTLILLFQLAPATFATVYWQKASAKGVIAGIAVGVLFWVITCGIPLTVEYNIISNEVLKVGIFGIDWLMPTNLFGLNIGQYAHSAFWAIGSNIVMLLLVSLVCKSSDIEKETTQRFIDIQKNPELGNEDSTQKHISLYDLQLLVGQYIGQDMAEKRFKRFANNENLKYELDEFANAKYLKFADYQLAGAIGASSARFVMALVLERKNVGTDRTIKLLDEATELISQNREILQSAIDSINQGICVLDEALEITCWNKAFQELLNIPDDILAHNRNFQKVLEYCAKNGEFGEGDVDNIVASRILDYVVLKKPVIENIKTTDKVVHINSASMPEGGCVITFDNVTQQVRASKELEEVNINLEHRVEARTEELTQLNDQLEKAKASAEEANIDKTRFLAAASHDISQPMNAARLYSTALLEKELVGDVKKIAQNLDLSLTSVEEILVALLDISRLDSGVFKAEKSHFQLNELFEQLAIEFRPLAEKKNLELKFVATSAIIESDRRHLRRILQNYLSNAIKYTEKGRVLIGCRHKGDRIRIDVFDTGHGVAPFQIKTIFKEFKRLESGMRVAQGVGLGLSIVDRISKMIGAELDITSEVDKGSKFSCFVDVGKKSEAKVINKNKSIAGRSQMPNLNVVCIDNEVEILDALETLLSSWGINGIYSETSKDALQMIEEKNIMPDAIIADYHLNFENGVFAIEKIRWQIDKPITAILATADRSEQVAKVCNNKDILLMHKPIKPAILRATLARIDVSGK